jgi:hypothetical protein
MMRAIFFLESGEQAKQGETPSRFSQYAAAGITAGAAVGAWQQIGDLFDTGIGMYGQLAACHSENSAEHAAQACY